ncbi:T-cell receptor alpha chain V region RL-5 [Fukomys damarensis]|nr:T-cell receptor alpha chain V region RL-5 [Fukomys damarensis]
MTMDCNYTSKGYPTLFWYVQYPNKALLFLQKETMENSRNFGSRNIKEKISPIVKYSVQVSDSAMYYCLLSDTVSRMQKELFKNHMGPDVVCTEAGKFKQGASFSLTQAVVLERY